MPNEHNLKPFKKGEDERRNLEGRPRKFVTELRDQGYKMVEINDTLMVLLSMDINELKDVFENPKATVLEKAVAGAIRKSIEKGSLYNIETIITRAMGKPKETIDTKNEHYISKLEIEILKSGIPPATSEKDVKL